MPKKFSDWNDFQRYISSSDKYKGLIEFVVTEAFHAIQELLEKTVNAKPYKCQDEICFAGL